MRRISHYLTLLMFTTIAILLLPGIVFADDAQDAGVYFTFNNTKDYYGDDYVGHSIYISYDTVDVSFYPGDSITVKGITYTYYDGDEVAYFGDEGFIEEPVWVSDEGDIFEDGDTLQAELNTVPKVFDPEKYYECTVFGTLYDKNTGQFLNIEITKSGTTDEPLAIRPNWYDINSTVNNNIEYTVSYEDRTATAWSTELFDEDGSELGYAKPGTLKDTITVPAGTFPVTDLYFYDNDKLTTINLTQNIKKLCQDSLVNTGLRSITIPETVMEIEDYAVGYTSKLQGYNSMGDAVYEYTAVPGFTIIGKTGSVAQAYAKKCGFTFKDPTEKENTVINPKTDSSADAVAAAKAREAAIARASNVNKATVTAVDIKNATALGVKSITLGPKVKKIKKNAFKGSTITTVTVKTKKLKAKAVKGSLKGSKVKTIKVKVGNKKANKQYVKKYKKIFTKKNAGKKAKVK